MILSWHFSIYHCLPLSITSFTSPYAFPSHSVTSAHFPLHDHFLTPESPPPSGIARNRSSSPGARPTTVSALHVRKARTRTPDLGPSGPMAVENGVVGSQCAW